MFDTAVKNGLIITENGVLQADIGIIGGKISAVARHGKIGGAKSEIDASGKYVFPGVIDAHVHFNDPGFPEREDMRSGTSAAAAGGVTTVIDMPLSGNPAVTSAETLELKKACAKERAIVDYSLWGGLVNDNVSEMKAMSDAGACAFKAFTCFAGDDFPYATPDVLYRGMVEAAKYGLLIGVHCEDEALTSVFEKRARSKPNPNIDDFLFAHSPLTEHIATGMVLEMALATSARVHICHASMPSIVEKVISARLRGAKVTVETCPHYLIFTTDDLKRLGAVLKCTPPVRSMDDAEGMWEMVINGGVDMIGSDHSPSTTAQKSGDFWRAWGGTNGVQTMLSFLFSEGVLKRGMPVERLCSLICANPAKIFGLPQKGRIDVGYNADIAILDPNEQWQITPDNLLYKNKHTPYMGMVLTGRVKTTIVRGKTIFAR